MKVNLSQYSRERVNLNWISNLINEFSEEYDIGSRFTCPGFIGAPEGCRVFVEWLQKRGFDVEYWELPEVEVFYDDMHGNKGYKKVRYAFGADFSDSCPRLVEIKLKAEI